MDDDLVVAQAHDVLARIHLVDLDALTIRRAIDVNPRALTTLDAIHVATALSLDPDLAGMVVYDKRLAASARAAGLTVWAPACPGLACRACGTPRRQSSSSPC